MAEGDASSRLSKSRILVDLTNRIEKRRCSEREKNGVGNVGLNGEQVFKRFRISPHPRTGINALKRNFSPSASKLTSEKGDPNVCGSAVSQNTVDAFVGCDSVHIPKKENVVTSDSEVYGENDDRVNKIELDLVNGEEGQAVASVSTEIYGCGNSNSLTDNPFDGSKVVDEESSCQEHFVGDNASGHGTICGDVGNKSGMGISNDTNSQNDTNSLNVSMVDMVQATNNEAPAEFGDSFPADNAQVVNKKSEDSKSADINISYDSTQEGSHLYHNDLDNHKAGNLVFSQSGSVDCTTLPDSQESAVGIDRPAWLKKQDDSIKSCTCSLCSKAGLILLDLHQQEIRARVTAIKKSQREAIMMSDRSLWSKVAEKHNYQSINRVSTMESHLMYQWRSLFQHTADIWQREGQELEASLQPLAGLRKKCKNDLESLFNAL